MTKATTVAKPLTAKQLEARERELNAKIQHSAKISKQVIKQQLKERLKTLNEQVDELSEGFNESKNAVFKEVSQEMTEKVKLLVASNPDIAALRQILKRTLRSMRESHKTKILQDNWGLVQVPYSNYEITRLVADYGNLVDAKRGHMAKRWSEVYEGLKASKSVIIKAVTFLYCGIFGDDEEEMDPNDEGQVSVELGEVELSDELVNKIIEHNDRLFAVYKVGKEREEVEQKLHNINELVEELEAKILVKELTESDYGREVLDMTKGLVKQALGDLPSLLESK